MIPFLSVCAGIEAASVAWEPQGFLSILLSEIEGFPRAVLSQRRGAVDARLTGAASRGVPLWGDFTALRVRHMRRLGIQWPSVLVGGTPCQDFSNAGLGASLSGARGNLTLSFVELADAIDNARFADGQGGVCLVWENVPGVLSTDDNAFGVFLGRLVGADTALVPGRRQRWTRSGMVAGPRRRAAWRTLDSQYFELAQRRERVFLVAGPLDGPDPAQVLLEQEGVRRHSPPRRRAREDVAGTVAGGARLRGGYSTDDIPIAATLTAAGGGVSGKDAPEGRIVQVFGGNNTSGNIDIAPALNACHTASGRQDFETEALVVADVAPALSARPPYGDHDGRDGLLLAQAYSIMPMNSGRDFKGRPTDIAQLVMAAGPTTGNQGGDYIVHTLRGEGFDASEDGTGRGVPVVPIAFPSNATAEGVGSASEDISPTLRAFSGSANAMAATTMAGVRRLMPVECERLQGFPDDYTRITWRGAGPADCPDGPRYKALGNSMSVPVMMWIGARLKREMEACGWTP